MSFIVVPIDEQNTKSPNTSLALWTRSVSWSVRPEHDQTWRTQLIVKVIEAHALFGKEALASDSYVVFGVAEELGKAKAKKKTPWLWKESTPVAARALSPQYRCSKTLGLEWDALYASHPAVWRLRFECWSADRLRDEILGVAYLELARVTARPRQYHLQLQPVGKTKDAENRDSYLSVELSCVSAASQAAESIVRLENNLDFKSNVLEVIKLGHEIILNALLRLNRAVHVAQQLVADLKFRRLLFSNKLPLIVIDTLYMVAPFDVDELVHEEPLLHIAVKYNNPDGVIWLLEHGSKAALVPTNTGTPITFLAKSSVVHGLLTSYCAKAAARLQAEELANSSDGRAAGSSDEGDAGDTSHAIVSELPPSGTHEHGDSDGGTDCGATVDAHAPIDAQHVQRPPQVEPTLEESNDEPVGVQRLRSDGFHTANSSSLPVSVATHQDTEPTIDEQAGSDTDAKSSLQDETESASV